MSLKRKLPENFINRDDMSDSDNENIAEIENIITDRVIDGIMYYHIKWVGSKRLTWIKESDFIQKELLEEYKAFKILMNDPALPRKAYIYLRTSKRNGVNEVSLDDQERQCKNFASNNQINVVGIFKDNGVSARNMKNQFALKHIISLLKEGQMIICYDISRFSRNIMNGVNTLEFIRLHYKSLVHAVFENITWNDIASNRHNFRQILSTAQLHSDTISAKVKSAIEFKKLRGDFMGKAPYGYKKITAIDGTKKLEQLKEEQDIINKIYDITIDIIADNINDYINMNDENDAIASLSSRRKSLTFHQYKMITDKINAIHKNRDGKNFSILFVKKLINKFNLF